MPNKKSYKKDTSWEKVSTWYDEYLEKSDDTLQAKVIAPNLIRLLNLKKGDRIIDIACGQGYFSRLFALGGAQVVGIDSSKSLIASAKEKSTDVKYLIHSADKMTGITDLSQDKAVIVLALENIDTVLGVLTEAKRVLIDGGSLHIVLMHPCFRIPKDSDWGYDETKKVQYRRTDLYMKEVAYAIDAHPGQKTTKKITTTSYHRPLQWYFKLFKKAGLSVVGLEEWISHKESGVGPRKMAEDIARKEFPMFLCVELKK